MLSNKILKIENKTIIKKNKISNNCLNKIYLSEEIYFDKCIFNDMKILNRLQLSKILFFNNCKYKNGFNFNNLNKIIFKNMFIDLSLFSFDNINEIIFIDCLIKTGKLDLLNNIKIIKIFNSIYNDELIDIFSLSPTNMLIINKNINLNNFYFSRKCEFSNYDDSHILIVFNNDDDNDII